MTKTLLMVDTSDHNNPYTEDVIEVEAYVVGGLDGVFAIYRLDNLPDVCFFASGDDGHWWRISNGLHTNWLPEVFKVIREATVAWPTVENLTQGRTKSGLRL